MKKLILTTVILVFTLISFSQYESIFGTTSTSWNVLSRVPSSNQVDSLVVCCDTLINGKNYKQVDHYGISNSSARYTPAAYFIREDTSQGKAWFRTSIDTNEVQFINMSLMLGDTMIFTNYSSSIVDSVYFVGGRKALRLSHFNTPYSNCIELNDERFILIEGIGFINNMQLTLGADYCSFLLCKRKDEILVYQNTSSAYGGYCNSNLVSTSEKQLDKLITIYPNPSSSNITIDKKDLEKITSIKMFNVNGKMIRIYNPFINNIDVSNYEKGIYFIVFETEKGSIYKKVVVN